MWSLEKLLRRPDLPVRQVTKAEFIAAMTALGETLAEAELQAHVNKHLGGDTLVGDSYLRVITEPE